MENQKPIERKADDKKGSTVTVTSGWSDIRINDHPLFVRLCQRYQFKPNEMEEKVRKIQYRAITRTLRTGAVQNGFELRTKGTDGGHLVVKSPTDGIWYCNCPRYLFKGGMRSLIPCKHLIGCISHGLGAPEDWFQYLV